MPPPIDSPTITKAEMQASLARLLSSRVFHRSERLRRFLEFTVTSLLEGKADELKEASLGVHVYDRKEAYEKSDDSIVRTEARRLRNKLQEYYRAEGQDDPVVLHFQTGSYVPTFTLRKAQPPASEPPRPAKANNTGTSDEKRGLLLAVLPLTDVSGSSYSSRCARMLTEEFVHGWTHTEGVTVVGLEVIPAALDSSGAIAAAQQKGVHFLTTGSVSEENGSLRVTLRLVRPDGVLVWSQQFNAKADAQGLHRLTTRLSSAMVSRLQPETAEIRKELQPINANYLAVLPMLLEAEALLEDGPGENLPVAAVKFEECVRRSPTNVRGICDLASCYCGMALHGVAGSEGLVRRAVEMAELAVGMEQMMGFSQSVLAYTRMLSWAWREAEEGCHRAMSSGDHVFTFRVYATFLITQERFDEAEFFVEKAQQIDPFSGRQKLLRTLFFYFARRSEDLQKHIDEEAAYGPLPAGLSIRLALDHAQNGRHQEAKQIASNCRKNVAGQPSLMILLAQVLALCGEKDQAAQIASAFRFFTPTSPVSFYRRALLLLSLEKVEDAWTALESALEKKEPELIWLKVEPQFHSLRSSPRFASLLEKVMPAA